MEYDHGDLRCSKLNLKTTELTIESTIEFIVVQTNSICTTPSDKNRYTTSTNPIWISNNVLVQNNLLNYLLLLSCSTETGKIGLN